MLTLRVLHLPLALALASISLAQPIPESSYSTLKWRNVGPFRGGRVSCVSGVIGKPGVYYMGLPAGGVWKSTNAGVTWDPIMDQVKEASSVGAIEVAPSDPNVIYVGMGDIIVGGGICQGNGLYKSTDAGKTWQYLGFPDAGHIGSIVVDQKDPNIVQVAIKGMMRKRTEDRGVFRSTDGGKTWTKTLFVSNEIGAGKIVQSWDQPEIMLAATLQHFTTPGTSGGFGGFGGSSGTKLFKSKDGGKSWSEVTGGGLPKLSGRLGLAIAQGTKGQRMFLVQNSGLYRSDDGGETWKQMAANDRRIRNGQGGYNCGVYVNTADPNTVYVVNTCSYVSRDGGNTFTGFKGAPGGDDPQQVWLDPMNGDRIFFGTDQGATVSLDGGRSWGNWYNQPSAQVYHIGVDNQVPYWIYATQQDSGAIGTASRGNLGAITPFDWTTNPGFEFGSIVADPLNPKVTYVGSQAGGICKVVMPSGTYTEVSPSVYTRGKYRHVLNQPLLFAPTNPRELLAGFQFVMVTTDGGQHWKQISPDLTTKPEAEKKEEPKKEVKKETKGLHENERFDEDEDDADEVVTGDKDAQYMRIQRTNRGGSIQCMSSSSITGDIIWVGTSNGFVQVTKDHGNTWTDVSITTIPNYDRADVLSIEASHFDPATAYVTLSLHTIGDYTPYVYRTQDFGKSWTRITKGIPSDLLSGNFSRVIREDTKRKGLLFLGTESSVYVSFNNGDSWQSLGLNLPNTSYRDMVVKGDDLVVGTYGRGFWILDDMSPLRELQASTIEEEVHFFKPADVYRFRRNVGYDTPFPPEVPHAVNPPLCTFSYFLKSNAKRVSIEIVDKDGRVVKHLNSDPVSPDTSEQPIPDFWKAIPVALPTQAGLARVSWNLRFDNPNSESKSYDINANPYETPAGPEGHLVGPGTYTVVLNVDGKVFKQEVAVKHDPRSPQSEAGVKRLANQMSKIWDVIQYARRTKSETLKLREAILAKISEKPGEPIVKAATELAETLQVLSTGSPEIGTGTNKKSVPGLANLFSQANQTLSQMDYGDEGPTEFQSKSADGFFEAQRELQRMLSKANADLNRINEMLKKAGLKPIG